MPIKLIKALSVTLIVLFFASCTKEKIVETINPVWNVRGNANSAQEAPTRVTSPATGSISGTYNKSTNLLSYTITWTGLTGGNPSAMHFHGPADPGISAPVVIPITGFSAAAAGSVSGTATLTDAQEIDFMNGLWYYNIHNATYPGGEIRGQIFLTQ